MSSIHSKYNFYLHKPDGNIVQIYPVNGKLSFKWELEQDQIFFRKKLETKLRLVNNTVNGSDDFDEIIDVEMGNQRCDDTFIVIDKVCNGVSYQFFKGRVILAKSTFDLSHCTAEIQLDPADAYECLMRSWEEEWNVFDHGQSVEISSLVGDIEIQQCACFEHQGNCSSDPYQKIDHCLSDPLTWSAVYHRQNKNSPIAGVTRWKREYVNQATSPGAGWTNVGGNKWVRPLPTVQTSLTDNSTLVEIEWEVIQVHLDNGRYLNDLLEGRLGECDYGVVSDFFGINPDSTAPDNPAYQACDPFCKEIVVAQKSDVKRPFADQNATIGKLTTKSLFEWLRVQFNVYPAIVDGNFRLEHITYYAKDYMLDLTQADLKHFINGSFAYKYDGLRIPKKEVFEFMEESRDPDFDGYPIVYDSNCVDPDNEEELWAADRVTNDIIWVRSKGQNEDEEGDVSDDGFCFISTEDEEILSDDSVLTGATKINCHLGFASLHENYHKHDRVLPTGKMNNVEGIQFYTWKRQKQQGPYAIQLCCSDLRDNFDPIDLIRTQLGWGEVKEATLSEPNNILEITSLHR